MTKPKYQDDGIDWAAARKRLASLVEGTRHAAKALDVLDQYAAVSRQVKPRQARIRAAQDDFYRMCMGTGLSLDWLIEGAHPDQPFREGNERTFRFLLGIALLPENQSDTIFDAFLALTERLMVEPDMSDAEAKRVLVDVVRKSGNPAAIARVERMAAA